MKRTVKEQENPLGLNQREAERLLLRRGPNVISGLKGRSGYPAFSGSFRDAAILFALAVAGVAAVQGGVREAAGIAVVLLFDALLGLYWEQQIKKAQKTEERLTQNFARVLRDGEERWVLERNVVAGDVLRLQAGDRVAADAILLSADALVCDETALGGEARKAYDAPPPGHEGGGETVFMGAVVTSGGATARVCATGSDTQCAKNVKARRDKTKEPEVGPPGYQGMRVFYAAWLWLCLAFCVIGLLRGDDWRALMLTGACLLVAALPEGADTAEKMLRTQTIRRILDKNILIRLHKADALSRVTVLCIGRTGILTQNRMTVSRLFTLEEEWTLGAHDTGGRACGKAMKKLLETAAFCSHARLVRRQAQLFSKAETHVAGEPVETALLLTAVRFGVRPEDFTPENEIPFDADRKRMTVTGRCADGGLRAFAKGAPEAVLPLCAFVQTDSGIDPMTPAMRRDMLLKSELFAADGLTMLAFACKEVLCGEDPEQNLVFLGLASLRDTIFPDAARAVARWRAAQVRPVLVTADSAAAARAIAMQTGLIHEGDQILTGAQLDGMDGQALLAACGHTPVFARVSPRHRLRIVQALRSRGETVAISGKHAWDVPAMEAADVGVAADGEAPQAVCEASGAILFGGGAPALAIAIEETRATEENLLRFVRYQLTCGAGLVCMMLFSVLMGMPPVLLPVQMLAVRLLANGPVAAALGGEPAGSIPRRREHGEDLAAFSDGLLQGVCFRAVLTALLSLGTFSVLLSRGAEQPQARAGAMAALVFSQLPSALSCRGESRAARRILPLDNLPLFLAALASFGLTLAVIYHPGLAGFLQTAPLNTPQLCLAAAAGGAAAAGQLFAETAFNKKEKTGRAVRLVRRGPV